MLKQMGTVTTAMFSFAMALLWGWMAWYLWDTPMLGKATPIGVAVLAALAFLSGVFSIYRSLIRPMKQGLAETNSGRSVHESEEQFVERMLAKLDPNSKGATEEQRQTAATIPVANEEDAMVARVLAKLEQQKAEREGGN